MSAAIVLAAAKLARLIMRLAPPVITALTELVRALDAGDDAAARKAYEAALREAFEARKRRRR